jgi:hypothetical protein
MENIFNYIKLVRRLKKGFWVKTTHRGWITYETYEAYLQYDFDPIIIKTEKY